MNTVVLNTTAPFDADDDVMPNWWEQSHSLLFTGVFGATGVNRPNGDPDFDTFANFDL